MMWVYEMSEASTGCPETVTLGFTLSAMTALWYVFYGTPFGRCTRRAIYHGHCQPRNTHQLLLLVPDLNPPDMAPLSNVMGARRRGHDAGGHRTKMVRVDLLSQTHVQGL